MLARSALKSGAAMVKSYSTYRWIIMFYVKTVVAKRSPSTPSDVLMAIITHETSDESVKDMQRGSLYHFHQRLGHLGYDAVERVTKDPESGIKITGRSRPTRVSCAEGKQTKNVQSNKDTGARSPTDCIGVLYVRTLRVR